MKNPYLGTPEEEITRLNVDIATDDILLIRSVFPVKGTTQAIVATLVQSIANELRAKRIDHYTPENRAVLEELVQRRASFRPASETNTRNDISGKKSVRAAPPRPTNQQRPPSKTGRGIQTINPKV